MGTVDFANYFWGDKNDGFQVCNQQNRIDKELILFIQLEKVPGGNIFIPCQFKAIVSLLKSLVIAYKSPFEH